MPCLKPSCMCLNFVVLFITNNHRNILVFSRLTKATEPNNLLQNGDTMWRVAAPRWRRKQTNYAGFIIRILRVTSVVLGLNIGYVQPNSVKHFKPSFSS